MKITATGSVSEKRGYPCTPKFGEYKKNVIFQLSSWGNRKNAASDYRSSGTYPIAGGSKITAGMQKLGCGIDQKGWKYLLSLGVISPWKDFG